jgi:hypothetical protein
MTSVEPVAEKSQVISSKALRARGELGGSATYLTIAGAVGAMDILSANLVCISYEALQHSMTINDAAFTVIFGLGNLALVGICTPSAGLAFKHGIELARDEIEPVKNTAKRVVSNFRRACLNECNR